MPYARKRSTRKSVRKTTSRKSNLVKKIAQVSKTVALRQAETKHVIRSLGVNYTLGHNTWDKVATNLLYSQQGTNDSNHRIGDQVTCRGVKLYCQLESKPTEPMIAYRIIVVKCRHAIAAATLPPLRTITMQSMMDPIDMEQVQKVYMDKIIYNKGQNSVVGLVPEGTIPTEDLDNRRKVMFKKFWIPLNNARYIYQDGATDIGRDYNIACWVSAYSHYVDGNDDTLGRGAFMSEFFFKDM